jgi:PD-(D/E)XK nuclease superfamily
MEEAIKDCNIRLATSPGCLRHPVMPIHKAQSLSYMKLLDVPLGLLFNFHEVKLVDGLSRLILPGANKP